MKIIGKAQGVDLLISATEDEVARLIGYHNAWYANKGQIGRGRIEIGPGLEITVNQMFLRLNAQAEIPEKVATAQKMLRESAELLGLVAPILQEVATGKPQETSCDSTKSS